MSTKHADGTAALDKALDVLDAVGSAAQGLSQAELAARLALPKTTLYRMLATLVARGLLRRDPLRRIYCLGFRCFEYARHAYAMPDLAAAAGIELRALRDLTGETTYLAALDGLDVISLDRCDGAHSQRSSAVLGQRKPLHCTSQGKAILAALDAAERERIVKDLPLAALTPHTITDRRRLHAELKVTAARGYAIDDEEIALGVRCCGAPIVDPAGRVRGAISVAGPAFRLTMKRVELLGPEVAQAARRIGAQLDAARPRTADGPVETVAGRWAFHGAFALWLPRQQALLWADTLAPALHRIELGAGSDELRDDCIAHFEAPLCALLREPDATLLSSPDGWLRRHDDGTLEAARDWPRRRLQAVCVAPDGRPWACVADGERWQVGPLGHDGSIGAGWSLAEPATAMAWAADGAQLCAVTPESGELLSLRPGSSTPRRVATVPQGSGRVSGIALDAEGGLWTALRDGWSVVRIGPDGAIDRVVGLPVPCPTDLAFGGARGDRLFIVSARDTLSIDALGAAPLSGRVFVLEAGVAGMPAHELRGPQRLPNSADSRVQARA
jgi:DNA-binding IclR family transcriptional regulator/sugar lactone lactonase YvrE